MKNKLFLILILVISYTMPSFAQKEIPPKTTFTPPTVAPNIFKVIGVTISVDSLTHPTNSASDIYLKITFTSMGKGTIKYNLNDQNRQGTGITNTSTAESVTVGGTGTDMVFIKRGTFIHSSHTYTITTTSPNQISSTP